MTYKTTKSILVTKATAELNEKVDAELSVKDPSPEEAQAVLKFIKKEGGEENVKNSE